MQTGYVKKGNVFTGFIGALIGTVVGIIAWLLLGRLNGEAAVHFAYRVNNVWGYFLALMEDGENQSVLIENLLTGLLFSALGCAGVIAGNAKSRKAEEAKAREAAALQQAMYNNPQSSVYMQNSANGQNAANGQSTGGYSDNTGNHY